MPRLWGSVSLAGFHWARGRRPHWGWRLALVLALALARLLNARPTAAQNSVALDALTIELWPEYDQPSMLIILRATLSPTTALPASITVHIPAAANGPSAVAVQDATGQLLDAPYTTAVQGDSTAVQVQVQSANFQVEYYDPGLKISGQARDYRWSWVADYAVKAATLQVQQPVDASGLTTEPPVNLAGSASSGLSYYTAALGALTAGQSVAVHLSYTKTTSTLSKQTIDQIAAAPTLVQSASVPQATAPGLPVPPLGLVIAAVSLVVLAIAVWGGLRLARQRQRAPLLQTAAPEPAAAGIIPPRPPPDGKVATQFCTQCGRGQVEGDRFCRNCGAPLRSLPGEKGPA